MNHKTPFSLAVATVILTAILSTAGCALVDAAKGEADEHLKAVRSDLTGALVNMQGSVQADVSTGITKSKKPVPDPDDAPVNDGDDEALIEPVPQARVRVITPEGRTEETSTDAEGEFSTPVTRGHYNVIAETVRQDDGKSFSSRQKVEVDGKKDVQRVEKPFTIVESGGLTGVARLADADEGDYAGTVVSVRDSGVFLLTDEFGSFNFFNVPDGTWVVEFVKSGYRTTAVEGVVVRAGQITQMAPQTLDLLPAADLIGLGYVRGLVLDDESGEPVVGALVSVRALGIPGVSNAEGEFLLTLAPGLYTLLATADGYELGEVQVDVKAGDESLPFLDLKRSSRYGGGRVRGKVIAADSGDPLSSAIIVSNPARGQGYTDDTGTFAMNLPVGCYTLAFAKGGFVQTRVLPCIEAGADIDLGDVALYGDDGATAMCVRQKEICDGKDNDCDGKIDEGNVCR